MADRATQTAFRLDPGLLEAAKRLARVRNATLTAIVQCALIGEIEGMTANERVAYDALLTNEREAQP